MQGGVNYNGNTLLTGGINVNTTGNIQALNVQVTENGERTITPPEGVDGYAPITIDTNVPIPEPVLDTLNVTSNGTYTPPSGTDGYDEITVNVPQSEPVLDDITITENGTYTPPSGTDGYDEITVNVPLPENAYLLEEYSDVPTDIASFTASDAPLKSLTVSIEPQQDLHGYDSPWAGGAGKNQAYDVEYNDVTDQYGLVMAASYKLKQGKKYVISFDTPNSGVTVYRAEPKQLGFNSLSLYSFYCNGKRHSMYGVATADADFTGKYILFRFDKTSATGTGELSNLQIEEVADDVTTPTDYAPYENICPISGWTEEVITVTDDLQNPTVTHTTTIPFVDGQGQSVTVYGGEIDVINGVVTPCPYYASYNGEQLTGEWISDRDVYSPNTTPTIGAQVVNIGATGTPLSVQPTSIKSLDGENNVFASTGQIEDLEFFTRETSV